MAPTFTPDEIAAEEWCAIPGCASHEVSSLGRIRPVSNPARVSIGSGNGVGYLAHPVRLDGRYTRHTVHSLVLRAFVGPRPDGLVIAHYDGVRDNNRLTNLRYATVAENHGDRRRHLGEGKVEERRGRPLSPSVVANRHLIGTMPDIRLAAQLGVSQPTVSRARRALGIPVYVGPRPNRHDAGGEPVTVIDNPRKRKAA